MGRILAIDYGKKRTGLAVTDPLRIIAGGLDTIPTHKVIPFLLNYIKENEVDLFILGEPRQMNYEYSESIEGVSKLKDKLQRAIPHINIVMVDERFTSVLANHAIAESGIGKKKKEENKGLVDMLSATILLQTYLETKR
ncbi:putative Holliday junction resolvase [Dysgonomonadaceae bacterium PH5-43]|nr:putative Holliday junction resolvase [Dysgonomonadaceae bacterium PH5-43]